LTPTVAIMGTAIKHPVPDRVKPSFVIFDIRTLWRSGQQWASKCLKYCQVLSMIALRWHWVSRSVCNDRYTGSWHVDMRYVQWWRWLCSVTGPWYHLHIIYGHQWTIRVDVMQNIIIVACLRLLITRNTALFWGQRGAVKAKCLFNMFEHNNSSCLIDSTAKWPFDLIVLLSYFLP